MGRKKKHISREPKHSRKITLYKGKRVDGLGYNLGVRTIHKGEVFISPPSKTPKSDTHRGYHYCDQVIPESVSRDTGVYDSQNVIVCLFDILKNIYTEKEYFVYKVGWHTSIYISELTDDMKNFVEPTDSLNINTILNNSIKVKSVDMSEYIITGYLYDYIDIFRYISSALSKNSDFECESRYKYLAPGNFIMTRNGNVYLLQPSDRGLRLVNSHYEYIGLPVKELYSLRLNCVDNKDLDIMKVYVCTNHSDSIKLWPTFFQRSFAIDWSTTKLIEWDWSRDYECY